MDLASPERPTEAPDDSLDVLLLLLLLLLLVLCTAPAAGQAQGRVCRPTEPRCTAVITSTTTCWTQCCHACRQAANGCQCQPSPQQFMLIPSIGKTTSRLRPRGTVR